MTKKRRLLPESTEKLSDDLRALRALRGKGIQCVISTRALDRFVDKAIQLERERETLLAAIVRLGIKRELLPVELERLQKEARERLEEIT